jgi:hypothetical protein
LGIIPTLQVVIQQHVDADTHSYSLFS